MDRSDLMKSIEEHVEDLTSTWIDLVRGDARIQSDNDLSEKGLRDHIPAVIEEICEMLSSSERPSVANTREARVHAYVRFRQGFHARELVRELSLLRMVLFDHLVEGVSSEAFKSDLKSWADTIRMINLYLDEEMSYAVSVYTESSTTEGAGDPPVES